MFWTEKVMLKITDIRTWCGVPTKMTSVFELFKCRTFSLIHAFTSSRQVVNVEDDRAAVKVKLKLSVISIAMKLYCMPADDMTEGEHIQNKQSGAEH